MKVIARTSLMKIINKSVPDFPLAFFVHHKSHVKAKSWSRGQVLGQRQHPSYHPPIVCTMKYSGYNLKCLFMAQKISILAV